jgi:SLOG in TRPM, prokaryote
MGDGDGGTVRAMPRVRRLDNADGEVRLRALGLPKSGLSRLVGRTRRRPVLTLAVGTARLPGDLAGRLLPIMRELVAVAGDYGAAIVTGGTDSGVIHLLGLALRHRRDGLVAIGVSPQGLVDAPPAEGDPAESGPATGSATATGSGPATGGGPAPGGMATDGPGAGGSVVDGLVTQEPDDAAKREPLEPNHDVAVLVRGSKWGDETAALSGVVAAVSGSRPAIAIVIGGGPIARAELAEHLRCGRPAIVVAGSGRFADEVAAGTFDEGDDDLAALLPSADVTVVNLNEGAAAFGDALRDALGIRPRRLRTAIPPLLVWPRLRVPDPPAAQLAGPGATNEYPLLADAIREAEQVVAPAFEDCDATAHREQNRHRLFTVLALGGGLATMVAGALQSWLSSSAWPGVVVAALGAATTALTTVARRQGALDLYLDARLRAEALRALYFEHISREPAAGEFERMERLRALQAEAARRRYEQVRP